MSMYNQYEDHEDCQEPSEFDEAVDGFKELLRKQVAQEVQDELTALRKSNRELSEQAKELPKLLQEAHMSKIKYETAARNAWYEANKLKTNELLEAISSPKYVVEADWKYGPKCNKCDSDRRLTYTTPLGKENFEWCECHVTHQLYSVAEVIAHTITAKQTGLTVWYAMPRDFLRAPDDATTNYIHTEVYYTPISIEKMMDDYQQFGFNTKESAQELADALNAKNEES